MVQSFLRDFDRRRSIDDSRGSMGDDDNGPPAYVEHLKMELRANLESTSRLRSSYASSLREIAEEALQGAQVVSKIEDRLANAFPIQSNLKDPSFGKTQTN